MANLKEFTYSHWHSAIVEKVLINVDQILYVGVAAKRERPKTIEGYEFEDTANSVINLPGYNLRVVETFDEIQAIINGD